MDAIVWIAERRIREAERAGAFADLPGAGRPLAPEDNSHVPEELRMAYKLLRNAGYMPEELAARRDIRRPADMPDDCPDPAEQLRLMRRLDLVMARIEAIRGRPVSLPDNARYRRLIRTKRPAPSGPGTSF